MQIETISYHQGRFPISSLVFFLRKLLFELRFAFLCFSLVIILNFSFKSVMKNHNIKSRVMKNRCVQYLIQQHTEKIVNRLTYIIIEDVPKHVGPNLVFADDDQQRSRPG